METDEAILAARAKLLAKGGGKGAALGGMRRKNQKKHVPSVTNDKKMQEQTKRMGCQTIPGIEEMNMFTEDGKVIHFDAPKLQAALGSNTFVVTGSGETKEIQDLIHQPGFINQLGPDNLPFLQNFAKTMASGEDDGVPDTDANFEEVSKEQEAD